MMSLLAKFLKLFQKKTNLFAAAAPALAAEMVAVARLEIGNGEEGGNNAGPHCDRYRFGRTSGAWCAWFLSWCLESAAINLSVPNPIKSTGGARRFFKRVSRAGFKLEKPEVGAIALWSRGPKGSWMGHVGIVCGVGPDGNTFHTIEGNRGAYPSKVDMFKHVVGEAKLLGFARLP